MIGVATCARVVIAMGLSSVAGAQEMPVPKPGPEHAVLTQDAGTWDAVIRAHDGARHAGDHLEGR